MAIAKQAAGDSDVVVLGANIARQCLENGLLDEIVVHVAPVLLGDGVRLFERHAGAHVPKLERTRIAESPAGAAHLYYRVEN